MIEFKNVSKTYDNGTEALKDVNIKINDGEFVFVVGSSGAGKSTFLKIMMREQVPNSGSVIINGYHLNNLKKKEIPLLLLIVLFSGYLLLDNTLTFLEGLILLIAFFALVIWSIVTALKSKNDSLESEMDDELIEHDMSLKVGIIWLVVGLVLLIGSSRLLVWGAVGVAHEFGVSDLIIGLTIVALGTSLPELAASVIAARKGEHDIAIGNVVGSNMFNILAVIGIAVVIAPMNNIPVEVLQRDWIIMLILTIALLVMSYSFKNKVGKITRVEGLFLILAYVAYNTYLGMALTGNI